MENHVPYFSISFIFTFRSNCLTPPYWHGKKTFLSFISTTGRVFFCRTDFFQRKWWFRSRNWRKKFYKKKVWQKKCKSTERVVIFLQKCYLCMLVKWRTFSNIKYWLNQSIFGMFKASVIIFVEFLENRKSFPETSKSLWDILNSSTKREPSR